LPLTISYISLALYILQPFSWLLMSRELNFVFLILPLLYILIEGRLKYIKPSIGLALIVLISGSFLFSQTWQDLYLIFGKILICVVMGLIGYYFGQKRQFHLYFFMAAAIFLVGDSLYRFICFKPELVDLITGSLAYKTQCTVVFSDSNASGVVVVQLLLILHLMKTFKYVSFSKWLIYWSILVVIASLTASKAAIIIIAIVYPLLYIFEKNVTSLRYRVIFIFVTLFVLFNLVYRYAEIDASFATKLVFLDTTLYVLMSDPLSILFGHGYVTGAALLSGEADFSHLMLALLLGSVGIIGSIGYYWLMWFSYRTYSLSLVPIILINMLSFSYFPPFFDYFVFFAFFYTGMASYFWRKNSLRVSKIPLPPSPVVDFSNSRV
jgi:hypothetical protein